MKKVGLGTKLIGGFLVVACMTLALGGLGWWGVGALDGHLKDVGLVRLPSVDSLLRVQYNLEALQVAQRSLMDPTMGDAQRDHQYELVNQARKRYQEAWKVYEPLPQTPEEAELWKKFVPQVQAWAQVNNQFFEEAKKLQSTHILNPVDLMRLLQIFRGDHYKLDAEVAKAIMTGQLFEGGGDPTQCRFGKWLAHFSTENHALAEAIQAVKPHHDAFHQAVAEIKAKVKEGQGEAAQGLLLAEMLPAADKTFELFRGMRAEADKSVAIYERMKELADQVEQAKKEPLVNLAGIIQINQDVADQAVASANSQATSIRLANMVGMALAFGLALLLGIVLSLGITRPLNRVIAGLSEGGQQVAAASGQVATASQGLAQGAAEQAASLEETSSSMEEMASMTRKNADNATQGDQLSQEASRVVAKAVHSMEGLTKAMAEISSAGEETAKIIKTIDEIAFQTNLLALNAAVEAARAGEAGAGFAVVADEVRNLAMRAAEAAKNTANLIEGTVTKTKQGSGLVDQTSQDFREVAESTGKVAELVGEIAAASQEQAQGIDQVNQAMGQMDKVTQQNAASAEESAAASEELSAQAETMQGFVRDLVSLVGGQARAGNGRRAELAAPAPRRLAYQPQDTLPSCEQG